MTTTVTWIALAGGCVTTPLANALALREVWERIALASHRRFCQLLILYQPVINMNDVTVLSSVCVVIVSYFWEVCCYVWCLITM
jgi:hypothetical protein